MNKLAKLALTAALALAITFTFNACEDKEKKQTPAEAATETQTAEQAKAEAEAAAAAAKAIAEAEAAAEADRVAKAKEIAAAETKAEALAEITSCGKGSSNVKLLECIADGDGKVQKKFKYDEQNRIAKIYEYFYYGKKKVDATEIVTITYGDSSLVTVESVISSDGSKSRKEFVKNGNTITVKIIYTSTVDNESFTINGDGYIIADRYDRAYNYKDGNYIGNGEQGYSYDDMKSPLSNSNTPKWLIQYLLESERIESKNNVLGYGYAGEISGSSTFKYEYDSNKFPIKLTLEYVSEGEEGTEITSYIYCGKN